MQAKYTHIKGNKNFLERINGHFYFFKTGNKLELGTELSCPGRVVKCRTSHIKNVLNH